MQLIRAHLLRRNSDLMVYLIEEREEGCMSESSVAASLCVVSPGCINDIYLIDDNAHWPACLQMVTIFKAVR